MILYGSKKDQLTRKVQRHASERGLILQFKDLGDQPLKAGELENLSRALGGWDNLIDKKSKAWNDLGMAYKSFDSQDELMEHPELLVKPILREGNKAWIVLETTDLSQILIKS